MNKEVIQGNNLEEYDITRISEKIHENYPDIKDGEIAKVVADVHL